MERGITNRHFRGNMNEGVRQKTNKGIKKMEREKQKNIRDYS